MNRMNRMNQRNQQKKYYKKIEYIGTITDLIDGKNLDRDFILVTLNEPYIAKNNEIIEKVAFYRSTGTSGGDARRKDMWFPCNGFVYDVQIVSGKGIIVAKMINKILWNISFIKMPSSMKETGLRHDDLKRFGTETYFNISKELGGGIWDEKYKSPKDKEYKTSYEINTLIDKNNSYGIKMNSALEFTKLKIQIVNSSYLKEGTDLYNQIQEFDRRIFSLNKYHMQKFEIKGIRDSEKKKEFVLKEKIPHIIDITHFPPTEDKREKYLNKLKFYCDQLKQLKSKEQRALKLEKQRWKAMQRFNQNIKKLRRQLNSMQRKET
jgi:hypothetical protein